MEVTSSLLETNQIRYVANPMSESSEERDRELEVARRWARRWKFLALRLHTRVRQLEARAATPKTVVSAVDDVLDALEHITAEHEIPAELRRLRAESRPARAEPQVPPPSGSDPG